MKKEYLIPTTERVRLAYASNLCDDDPIISSPSGTQGYEGIPAPARLYS